MLIVRSVFAFLVFPGFLFTAVVGLLSTWVDRKVTARVQYRSFVPWRRHFSVGSVIPEFSPIVRPPRLHGCPIVTPPFC